MKDFALEQFLEPLMDHPSYFTKRMFAGLAIYYNELMVFVLTEKPGEREWRGVTSDFDIWNGVLVCTSRVHHDELKKIFKSIVVHPVIQKWQYLPMENELFESDFDKLILSVKKGSELIGIFPGTKKRSKKKKQKKLV